MQHSIPIYPDGMVHPDKAPKLFFYSLEQKKEYIHRENRFAKTEIDKYLLTTGKEKREEAKHEMYKKRVLFAKQQDYGPKPGNKKVWVHQRTNDNRIA